MKYTNVMFLLNTTEQTNREVAWPVMPFFGEVRAIPLDVKVALSTRL